MTEHLHINKTGTSFWNSIITVAADAVEIYNNWGLIQYQISLSSELEVSKRFGGSNSLRPNTTSCGINNQCQHWFKKWLAAWRHQAITWTNADIHVLSIGLLGTNFSQILFAIQEFSTSKCIWNVICKMSAILFRFQYIKCIYCFETWQRTVQQYKMLIKFQLTTSNLSALNMNLVI